MMYLDKSIIIKTALLLLTVLLATVSFYMHSLHWLSFICLIPFAFLLTQTKTVKKSLVFGGLCALLLFIASFYWLVRANIYFAQSQLWVVCLVFLLFCIWQSIPYLILSYSYAQFQWQKNHAGPFLAASTLTLAWLIVPSPLPWLPLNSLYVYPKFIAILDLSGISMLLFLSTLFCFSAEYVFRKSSPYSKHYWALLLTIPIAMLGYGELRQWQLENNKANAKDNQWLNIGYIQPSLDYRESSERAYHLTKQLIAKEKPDLIVWPEIPTRYSFVENYEDKLRTLNIVRQYDQDILVVSGFVRTGKAENNQATFYNQSQLIENTRVTGVYSKEILVPFFEYLPKAASFLRPWMPLVRYYSPGVEQEPLSYRGVGLAMATCYEVIFPAHVHNQIKTGGKVIINPSSDSVFEGGMGGYYHLAIAFFRVIENRVAWVRSTNSGISIIVGEDGNSLTTIAKNNEVAFASAKVFIPEKVSVYGQWGDWFKFILLIMLLIYLFYEKVYRTK